MYTIKKIRPEEAKCYHDISLEVMRKTCVNESSDSVWDTRCAHISFSSILHNGVSYNMK